MNERLNLNSNSEDKSKQESGWQPERALPKPDFVEQTKARVEQSREASPELPKAMRMTQDKLARLQDEINQLPEDRQAQVRSEVLDNLPVTAADALAEALAVHNKLQAVAALNGGMVQLEAKQPERYNALADRLAGLQTQMESQVDKQTVRKILHQFGITPRYGG